MDEEVDDEDDDEEEDDDGDGGGGYSEIGIIGIGSANSCGPGCHAQGQCTWNVTKNCLQFK